MFQLSGSFENGEKSHCSSHHAHEPFADGTVWKDNPIKDKTVKTIGYESGIGIDCSDLVAQALWAAQFDVTYLHTLRYSALWAKG
jgi:hypothetical protein